MHQLQILKDAVLVGNRPKGKTAYCFLSDDLAHISLHEESNERRKQSGKQLEQIEYTADWDDFHAFCVGFELVHRPIWNGDLFKAETSAFADSDIDAGDGSAFAGKTDFAKSDQIPHAREDPEAWKSVQAPRTYRRTARPDASRLLR